MTERFLVGVVASTHGLQGEVNVYPTTDDPQRFKKLKKITLDTGRNGLVELEIEHVKFTKKFVILKFKGWDKIEDVERYRGKELTIDRADAVELEDGEYFAADLIGLKVFSEEGDEFGTIVDVMATGANDVYELKRNIDAPNVMLPAIHECIKEINLDEGKMVIHIMNGLLD